MTLLATETRPAAVTRSIAVKLPARPASVESWDEEFDNIPPVTAAHWAHVPCHTVLPERRRLRLRLR